MKKDKLIESFFFQKENLLSEGLIEELVRHQFKSIKLENSKSSQMAPMSRDFVLKSIPNIEIDELFWANMGKDQMAAPLGVDEQWTHEYRGMLHNFTRNTKGANLEQKIKNIENFYKIQDVSDFRKYGLTSTSYGERVGLLISYLVFIKTLTKILSQINRSSAGNVFEAFLAVLLNGKQLQDKGSIIDIEAPDANGPIYLSCKLLAEDSATAKGSIRNLQKDLSDGKTVYYVLAIKAFPSGDEVLDKDGNIDFYKVPLNLEDLYNFFNVAGTSGTKESFRILNSYISGDKNLPTIKKIPSKLAFSQSLPKKEKEPTPKKDKEGLTEEDSEDNEPVGDDEPSGDFMNKFASFQDSMTFFNKLSLQEKSEALAASYGHIATKQFYVAKNKIPEELIQHIATLTIGKNVIARLVNKFKNQVFMDTLSVVSNLISANQSFNLYISEGMKDDTKAKKALDHIKDSESGVTSVISRKVR